MANGLTMIDFRRRRIGISIVPGPRGFHNRQHCSQARQIIRNKRLVAEEVKRSNAGIIGKPAEEWGVQNAAHRPADRPEKIPVYPPSRPRHACICTTVSRRMVGPY